MLRTYLMQHSGMYNVKNIPHAGSGMYNVKNIPHAGSGMYNVKNIPHAAQRDVQC
jgi:plastocyanin